MSRIIELKESAEKEITKILSRFEKETSLHVDCVEINSIDITELGGRRLKMASSVRVVTLETPDHEWLDC